MYGSRPRRPVQLVASNVKSVEVEAGADLRNPSSQHLEVDVTLDTVLASFIDNEKDEVGQLAENIEGLSVKLDVVACPAIMLHFMYV